MLIKPSGVSQGQLQTNNFLFAVSSGSANTYVCTYAPSIANYVEGSHLFFKADSTNTGACTFNANGLGTLPIYRNYNTALSANDILINSICEVVIHSTFVELISPINGLAKLSDIPNFQSQYESSYQSVTSSTYTDITNFNNFTLLANSVYEVFFSGILLASPNNARFSFTLPSNAESRLAVQSQNNINFNVNIVPVSGTGNLVNFFTASSGEGAVYVSLRGTITTITAGTLKLQLSNSVDESGYARIYPYLLTLSKKLL